MFQPFLSLLWHIIICEFHQYSKAGQMIAVAVNCFPICSDCSFTAVRWPVAVVYKLLMRNIGYNNETYIGVKYSERFTITKRIKRVVLCWVVLITRNWVGLILDTQLDVWGNLIHRNPFQQSCKCGVNVSVELHFTHLAKCFHFTLCSSNTL